MAFIVSVAFTEGILTFLLFINDSDTEHAVEKLLFGHIVVLNAGNQPDIIVFGLIIKHAQYLELFHVVFQIRNG